MKAKVRPLSASRIIITNAPGSLRIVIPVSRSWFVICLLGFWICAWAVAEVMVPGQFLNGHVPPEGESLLFAWFVVWTIGGLLAVYAWFWQVMGKEVVTVGGQALTIRRDIAGFGVNKTYEVQRTRSLRVEPVEFNPLDVSAALRLWGVGGGMIAFDYEAKTHRFGAGLDEVEAKQVVSAVKKCSGIRDSART